MYEGQRVYFIVFVFISLLKDDPEREREGGVVGFQQRTHKCHGGESHDIFCLYMDRTDKKLIVIHF